MSGKKKGAKPNTQPKSIIKEQIKELQEELSMISSRISGLESLMWVFSSNSAYTECKQDRKRVEAKIKKLKKQL